MPGLNPLNWSTYDRTLYGSMAFLGAGAYMGIRHGDPDESLSDRATSGIAKLGMAGAGVYGLSRYGFKRAGNDVWGIGRSYFSRLQANSSAASGVFGKAKAFATLPVLGGAGALIGAAAAGEDHRTKGALIGGGAGMAASLALHGASVVQKMGPVGRGAGIAGVVALAFGAGQMLSDRSRVDAAAVADPETGEMQYADPSAAQTYRSGAGRRAHNMNATGDVVLGSHNRRHG